MPGRLNGIGWVYLFAGLGLTMVSITVFGNILTSFSAEGSADKYTLGNYVDLFSQDTLFSVTARTAMLGIGTVFWMSVFSFPFTWLLARTDFRYRTGLFTLLTAKLAIPGFITAMAYVWLFNPTSGLVNQFVGMTKFAGGALFDVYQLAWICFLQGIVLVPGGVFMMLPAFRNMDSSLEEAAWVSGVSKFQTARRVVLPLLAPSMLAVAIFYFVLGVEMFDFVAIIGMPGDVLVLWIYDAISETDGPPNLGFAGAAGVALFAICGVAIVFYARFLKQAKKYAVVGGKVRASAPQPLGRWKWAAYGWIGPLDDRQYRSAGADHHLGRAGAVFPAAECGRGQYNFARQLFRCDPVDGGAVAEYANPDRGVGGDRRQPRDQHHLGGDPQQPQDGAMGRHDCFPGPGGADHRDRHRVSVLGHRDLSLAAVVRHHLAGRHRHGHAHAGLLHANHEFDLAADPVRAR